MQSTRPGVFFGGDAAFGPKNIIWAVAHGHQAAISIHNHCSGTPVSERPPQGMNLITQKMGLSEWSYTTTTIRPSAQKMKHVDLRERFEQLNVEVELGFDPEQTAREVQRCLNCDIQTVFTDEVHRVRRLHRHLPGAVPDHHAQRRGRRTCASSCRRRRPTWSRSCLCPGVLPQTGRVMVKDEDVCVHCGLCAERCPTAAWDMQKFDLIIPHAGNGTRAVK